MNATKPTQPRKWTYTVIAKGKLGGFEAYLLEGGATLFVKALAWKGAQPRITLERYPAPVGQQGEWGWHDEGFRDWLPVLEPCNEVHTFQGDNHHAQNLEDQWLCQWRDVSVSGPYGRRAQGLDA